MGLQASSAPAGARTCTPRGETGKPAGDVWALVTMRRTLLLATLLLAATATTLLPSAAATTCANESPVDDVACEAERVEATAECLATRPPMHWYLCRVQL